MTQISFDNVGILADVRQTIRSSETVTASIPFGVKTPLRYASGTLFEMNYTIGEQISDNLANLIGTEFGERVGIPQYGTNLKATLAEFVSLDDFNAKAMTQIKTACSIWMPYIDLRGYEAFPQFESGRYQRQIRLLIAWRVPQIPSLASQNQITEVILSTI